MDVESGVELDLPSLAGDDGAAVWLVGIFSAQGSFQVFKMGGVGDGDVKLLHLWGERGDDDGGEAPVENGIDGHDHIPVLGEGIAEIGVIWIAAIRLQGRHADAETLRDTLGAVLESENFCTSLVFEEMQHVPVSAAEVENARALRDALQEIINALMVVGLGQLVGAQHAWCRRWRNFPRMCQHLAEVFVEGGVDTFLAHGVGDGGC